MNVGSTHTGNVRANKKVKKCFHKNSDPKGPISDSMSESNTAVRYGPILVRRQRVSRQKLPNQTLEAASRQPLMIRDCGIRIVMMRKTQELLQVCVQSLPPTLIYSSTRWVSHKLPYYRLHDVCLINKFSIAGNLF